jgi:bifunctional UDP-N-acetylglucosamine pyrophosphorylase/glucosamine-1-phosphate N-acetyltransferase
MRLGIIAAGGKGTRMNSAIPKPLTVLPDGNTFLSSMIKRINPFVDQIAVVTSLDVLNHSKFKVDSKCAYVTQLQATGMGDAVFCALEMINESKEIMILWCDQIGITSETIAKTCESHRKVKSNSHMTIPVLSKTTRYIHIDESNGKINRILQAREGDTVPTIGRSDIGLFLFSSGSNLTAAWSNGGREFCRGQRTNEYNFLPMLPYLSSIGWSAQTIEATPKDGVGVNTQEELSQAILENKS